MIMLATHAESVNTVIGCAVMHGTKSSVSSYD